MNIRVFDKLPDDARNIREEVFVAEQGFAEEFDTVDYRAIHFVAYDDSGAPMGTCRIFTQEADNIYYLGRLAVLKEYRNMKIGSALISAAESVARTKNSEYIYLHSQVRARQFYQKCGYEAFGEVDLDENCPHIWMKKCLK